LRLNYAIILHTLYTCLNAWILCRRTSDSRTCHTAVLHSSLKTFILVSGTKAQH